MLLFTATYYYNVLYVYEKKNAYYKLCIDIYGREGRIQREFEMLNRRWYTLYIHIVYLLIHTSRNPNWIAEQNIRWGII